MQTNDNLNLSQDNAEVQPKLAGNAAVAFTHKAIIKVKPEAVQQEFEDRRFEELLNSGDPIMAPQLKEHISFRALLEADGHRMQVSGKYTKCRCPFHPDNTPSFTIFEDDSRAKCYGCNWYGDIFKYEEEFHRLDDFKAAWRRLNDFIRKFPRTGRKAKAAPAKAKAIDPEFTPRQLKERKLYADRLANEEWLADAVCRRRFEYSGENWNPEVIRRLAGEGSLGWAACLAFLYPTGSKYRRWPDKELIWEGSTGLWRGQFLSKAQEVYLTESETDAIALLHSDLEKVVGNLVVAAPSATTFKAEWAPLFKDKVVIFCFDNDRAGEEGVEKIAKLLAPYAKQLRTVDLKEVK